MNPKLHCDSRRLCADYAGHSVCLILCILFSFWLIDQFYAVQLNLFAVPIEYLCPMANH